MPLVCCIFYSTLGNFPLQTSTLELDRAGQQALPDSSYGHLCKPFSSAKIKSKTLTLAKGPWALACGAGESSLDASLNLLGHFPLAAALFQDSRRGPRLGADLGVPLV